MPIEKSVVDALVARLGIVLGEQLKEANAAFAIRLTASVDAVRSDMAEEINKLSIQLSSFKKTAVDDAVALVSKSLADTAEAVRAENLKLREDMERSYESMARSLGEINGRLDTDLKERAEHAGAIAEIKDGLEGFKRLLDAEVVRLEKHSDSLLAAIPAPPAPPAPPTLVAGGEFTPYSQDFVESIARNLVNPSVGAVRSMIESAFDEKLSGVEAAVRALKQDAEAVHSELKAASSETRVEVLAAVGTVIDDIKATVDKSCKAVEAEVDEVRKTALAEVASSADAMLLQTGKNLSEAREAMLAELAALRAAIDEERQHRIDRAGELDSLESKLLSLQAKEIEAVLVRITEKDRDIRKRIDEALAEYAKGTELDSGLRDLEARLEATAKSMLSESRELSDLMAKMHAIRDELRKDISEETARALDEAGAFAKAAIEQAKEQAKEHASALVVAVSVQTRALLDTEIPAAVGAAMPDAVLAATTSAQARTIVENAAKDAVAAVVPDAVARAVGDAASAMPAAAQDAVAAALPAAVAAALPAAAQEAAAAAVAAALPPAVAAAVAPAVAAAVAPAVEAAVPPAVALLADPIKAAIEMQFSELEASVTAESAAIAGKINESTERAVEAVLPKLREELKNVVLGTVEQAVEPAVAAAVPSAVQEAVAPLQEKVAADLVNLSAEVRGMQEDAQTAVQAVLKESASRIEDELTATVESSLTKSKDEIKESLTATEERLAVRMVAKVQAEVDRIPRPRDGKDGEDGKDGKDAKVQTPVPFEAGHVYEYGTWVVHGGGVWVAARSTTETPGPDSPAWDCVAAGITAFEPVLQDDGRTLKLHVQLANGVEFQREVKFMVPITRGVYRVDSEYEEKDIVLHDGSWWEAQKAGKLPKPGTDPAWRLQVKHGKDGRNGKDAPPAVWKHRGEWDAEGAYEAGDIVGHAGVNWLALKSTRDRPPFVRLISNDVWLKLGS